MSEFPLLRVWNIDLPYIRRQLAYVCMALLFRKSLISFVCYVGYSVYGLCRYIREEIVVFYSYIDCVC